MSTGQIPANFGTLAKRLGWSEKPGEADGERLLRREVLSLVAIDGGDQQPICRCQEIGGSISKNECGNLLRHDRYRAAGGRTITKIESSINSLLPLLNPQKDRTQKNRFLNAIGRFDEPEIACSALNLLLTDDFDIRDVARFLRAFQQEPETENLAWEFVKENYEKLVPRLPSRLGVAPETILLTSGAFFCSADGRNQVASFWGSG